MRLAFIADARSTHARRWIDCFVQAGDEVLVLSTFPGPEIPGAKMHVLPGLFRVGNSLTVSRDQAPKDCPARRSTRLALLTRWGRVLFPIWQQARALELPFQIRRARKLLDAFEPDLVHALRVQNEGYIGAWAAGSRPLVMSSWGSDFISMAARYPVHRLLTRLAAAKPAAFTADCQRDLHLAREHGLPASSRALLFPGNGGIDRALFHPGDREQAEESRLILYSRGYSPFARIDVLLAAYQILHARNRARPSKLLLLLPKELAPMVEAASRRLGLPEGAIEVRPLVQPEEMAGLLRNTAVVVSPMESDGTPATLLEAMASGAFPVMSDLESIREWVKHGENGLLFDPDDVGALARCLERALDDHSLRRSAREINARLIDERADRAKVMPEARRFYGSLISVRDASPRYSFERVELDKLDREEFEGAATKSIFTTIPWIGFVRDDAGARPVIVRIRRDGRFLGYFSGLMTSKLGVKILGSPFRGWSTCFMGLDSNDPAESARVLPELVPFLFRTTGCHYFECVDRNLPPTRPAGFPFKTRSVETLELEINKTDEELLAGARGDCRTFIKQFEKRGARLEIVEPDDRFAEEYHDQLKDVFAKQGLVPTYGVEKVKRLFKALRGSGMLLCLRVVEPGGKSIATSIFLGYKSKCFFWGGASYREFQKYRPNEYMIWQAIRYWRDRGARVFDMVGVRDYKLKFGARRVEYGSVIAARWPALIVLRDAAEALFFKVLALRGAKLADSDLTRFANLEIKESLDHEIAHYCDGRLKVFSKANRVFIIDGNGHESRIDLPMTLAQRLISSARLMRRAARLDKCCVVPTATGFSIFWQGIVYHAEPDGSGLVPALTMTGCRNPMHNSIANIDGSNLYFGEYGPPHKAGKSVYHSADGGRTWEKIFNISCDKIRHIHSCKWDPYERKIWVFTGDFEGQAQILCADPAFKQVEWIGDGSQVYRVVDAIFERDAVHWIMDSPLAEVHHVKLDRRTRTITMGQAFPGPVWYMKRLSDGVTLAATVQEVGPSHKDLQLHIYASRNLSKWVEVARFDPDCFKSELLKFGVASFADGDQSSEAFYIHFEAVKGLDGKTCVCSLFGI